MFVRQDDRKWEHLGSDVVTKDLLRDICADCMTEKRVFSPYSSKKRKVRSAYFSPYGPGGVVDIIINNQTHHPEWALGFSVWEFTQRKKSQATLSAGGRFDGLKLYPTQNIVSVRIRRYDPGKPFQGPSISFAEYLISFSFDIQPQFSKNDPLEPHNRQHIQGKARLASVSRCDGNLVSDSAARRCFKLDKAIEVKE